MSGSIIGCFGGDRCFLLVFRRDLCLDFRSGFTTGKESITLFGDSYTHCLISFIEFNLRGG